jgi:hypothetical protein
MNREFGANFDRDGVISSGRRSAYLPFIGACKLTGNGLGIMLGFVCISSFLLLVDVSYLVCMPH